MTNQTMLGCGLIAATTLLAGCFDPYYYEGEEEYGALGPVLQATPPPPMIEEIPPEPFLGAVWVPGYWNWGGTRYLWIRGRHMRPPRPGVVWYPGGYIRRGYGYAYVSGRWVSPGWRPRYNYIYGNIAFHPRYRSYYYVNPGGQHYYGPGRGYRSPPPYGHPYWQGRRGPAPGYGAPGHPHGYGAPGQPHPGYGAPGRPHHPAHGAPGGHGAPPPYGRVAPGPPPAPGLPPPPPGPAPAPAPNTGVRGQRHR